MKETVQQYIQRILGNVGEKNPLAVQRATPAKLAQAIKGLKPAQLRKRPEPGKWSIAEILAHLADAEIAIAFRLRMVISQNGAPLQAYDQDLWAEHCNYAKHDARQSANDFRALRERNLRLLKGIPKSGWENYGMHSERGKETLAHITRMIAGHDLNHLRQVEGLAKKWKGR